METNIQDTSKIIFFSLLCFRVIISWLIPFLLYNIEKNIVREILIRSDLNPGFFTVGFRSRFIFSRVRFELTLEINLNGRIQTVLCQIICSIKHSKQRKLINCKRLVKSTILLPASNYFIHFSVKLHNMLKIKIIV